MTTYKKTLWACMALFITLSAFTTLPDFGKRKHLIGKWMPEKVEMEGKTKTFDPNDGEERSIEFTKDGKYLKDGSEGGTWNINRKGNVLTIKGGEFEADWSVKELNKKRCTIEATKKGRTATLYLIPYKKVTTKKD